MNTVITDQAWSTAQHVWRTGADEVGKLVQERYRAQFQALLELLSEMKGRIVTSGCGTSGAAAKKIAHTFSCIERPATFLSPADAVHGALGTVQPDDVAVFFSKGGNTPEILSMIPAIKTKKATLVGVTENPDSVLSREADYTVNIRVEREADQFNMLATTSTMAVIAFFDALAIALIDATGYSKEQFAVIHPGGAVGERLLDNKGD